jgi:hypothetical protein
MPKRSIVIMSVLAVAGAALLAGCQVPLNTLEDGLHQDAPVTEVHITGGSGNVTIIGDGTTGVDVRRTARYGAESPGNSMGVAGSTLNLNTDCGRQCSASYEVHVARGVRVTGDNNSGNVTARGVSTVELKLDSGNITVAGATGAVTVEADSGNIDISDIGGTVNATVSSGNIDGRDLRGGQNTLNADSGTIEVTLPGTGNLNARAESGNVTVRLPDGCCQIRTEVHSGRVRVDVREDPQSTHLVDLRADSGNIEVHAS